MDHLPEVLQRRRQEELERTTDSEQGCCPWACDWFCWLKSFQFPLVDLLQDLLLKLKRGVFKLLEILWVKKPLRFLDLHDNKVLLWPACNQLRLIEGQFELKEVLCEICHVPGQPNIIVLVVPTRFHVDFKQIYWETFFGILCLFQASLAIPLETVHPLLTWADLVVVQDFHLLREADSNDASVWDLFSNLRPRWLNALFNWWRLMLLLLHPFLDKIRKVLSN